VIARGASLLLAVALAASCSGGGRAAPSAATAAAASASATPIIDVNDMMGAFPPATFFVVVRDQVHAIALLNHATKYVISTGGYAQVAALPGSGRVYVMDQEGNDARLRWFDVTSGAERASRLIPDATVLTLNGNGALSVDPSTGTVLALVARRNGVDVEEFDGFTLRPAATRLRELRCGQRLLAGGGRVAAVCLNDGSIVLSEHGTSYALRTGIAPLVAAAMLGDGTIMVGARDGTLARIARGTSSPELVTTVKASGAHLVDDGIAVNSGCCFVLGVTLDEGIANVQVRVVAGGFTMVAFPAKLTPSGGLLVQPPFAYYTMNGQARHIDLQQGFEEVMTKVGDNPLPGAVADR
jgi:hypothetical protein